jgi:hypothetical protein
MMTSTAYPISSKTFFKDRVFNAPRLENVFCALYPEFTITIFAEAPDIRILRFYELFNLLCLLLFLIEHFFRVLFLISTLLCNAVQVKLIAHLDILRFSHVHLIRGCAP